MICRLKTLAQVPMNRSTEGCTNAMATTNRRNDFRVDVSVGISLEAGAIAGQTVNLSCSGMLVEIDPGRVLPDELTDFRLHFPDGTDVRGLCRVVREADQDQGALAFVRISERSASRIRSFLFDQQAQAKRAQRGQP
jgi:c-di-GMP-binding flagellar brake protein YcgR